MPLLSLIEDNLNFVQSLDIEACSLSTSGRSAKEERRIGEIYREIGQLKYKIVYLTPEKLVNSPGFLAVVSELYEKRKIDRFVIDEVHCVSSWGQDFRKDYLSLDMLKRKFPEVPLLGLTATATLKVKEDIA
jgi:superfamily II DNA helicase RecQ